MYLLSIIFLIISVSLFGQNDPNKDAESIVEEGRLLYRTEMAAWAASDWFLDANKDKNISNVGGYLSYLDKERAVCVFFSISETPKVLASISFDSTYSLATAKTDLSERQFSNTEKSLYQIRKLALETMSSDTLFKVYKDTGLNLIPLINEKEKKAYVLTGAKKAGVVFFGNDYLMTFDKDNKLLTKKRLHNNIIAVQYAEGGEGYHTHRGETGDLITATDICTLLLYSKLAKWKNHSVISKKYLSLWDCEKATLLVLPKEVLDKIDQKDKK